jgi:glucose-1-phosphate thymidylyltransferase
VRAILLCAGFGTRLHPITRERPKALLEVRGRALLDDLVDRLLESPRVSALQIVSNHRFIGHFRAFCEGLAARRPGLPLDLVDDGATEDARRLGAVRDLALALERAPATGPVLVAAGDNLFRFHLDAFLDEQARRRESAILVYPEPDSARLRRSGVAVVGAEGGRVLRFVEKPAEPPSGLACPPLYVFEPPALARLPEFLRAEPSADAPGSFLAWLVSREPVFAHAMQGRRYAVGDLESWTRAGEWLDRVERGEFNEP